MNCWVCDLDSTFRPISSWQYALFGHGTTFEISKISKISVFEDKFNNFCFQNEIFVQISWKFSSHIFAFECLIMGKKGMKTGFFIFKFPSGKFFSNSPPNSVQWTFNFSNSPPGRGIWEIECSLNTVGRGIWKKFPRGEFEDEKACFHPFFAHNKALKCENMRGKFPGDLDENLILKTKVIKFILKYRNFRYFWNFKSSSVAEKGILSAGNWPEGAV